MELSYDPGWRWWTDSLCMTASLSDQSKHALVVDVHPYEEE
jgi:hypothetical protein